MSWNWFEGLVALMYTNETPTLRPGCDYYGDGKEDPPGRKDRWF
jgi:hypothetical protein